MGQPRLKTGFKAPEGRYELLRERTVGLTPFAAARPTRLALASPATGPHAGAELLLFNSGDAVHVCPLDEVDRPPLRSITFPPSASGAAAVPLCIAWRPPPPGSPQGTPDTLVGLSTGETVVLWLERELEAGGVGRAVSCEALPPPDVSDPPPRCVSVAWGPGGVAVAALASGDVCVYDPPFRLLGGAGGGAGGAAGAGTAAAGVGPASGSPRAPPLPPVPSHPRRTPARALRVAPAGLTAASLSPDGTLLATAGRDGVLRVHDHATATLVTGFKSYFGGLHCVAWSADGRCVAAGGEDDTACVFGLSERCALGWADGAESWVAAVAFDPFADDAAEGDGDSDCGATGGRPAEATYRIAVASQDCGVALHDVAVPDPDFAASLPPLSPRAGGELPPHLSAFGSPPVGSVPGAAANGAPAPLPAWAPDLPPEIAPPPPCSELAAVPAVARAHAHAEPLSDVLFTRTALVTACHAGAVKVWARPGREGERTDGAGPPRSAPVAVPLAPRVSDGPPSLGSPDPMSL